MADSNSVIQKRKRAHALGDHSLCSAARCEKARRELPVEAPDDVPLDLPGDYGAVARATVRALALLPYGPDDPRYVTMLCAVRLARAFDISPTPGIAAELRHQIAYLQLGVELGEADEIDARRARLAQLSADMLIKHALSIVPDPA